MKKSWFWIGIAFLLPTLTFGGSLVVSSEARQVIYKAIADFGPSSWQRWAIEKVEPTPEAVAFYLSLDDLSPESRTLVEERIQSLGAKAPAALLQVAQNSRSMAARSWALQLLTALSQERSPLDKEQLSAVKPLLRHPDPLTRSGAAALASLHYFTRPEHFDASEARDFLAATPSLDLADRPQVFILVEAAAAGFKRGQLRSLLDQVLALEDKGQACDWFSGRLAAQLARRLGRPALEELFRRRRRDLEAVDRDTTRDLDRLADLGFAMGGYPEAARPELRASLADHLRSSDTLRVQAAIRASGPLGASEGAALLTTFDAIYDGMVANQRLAISEALLVMAFVDPAGAAALREGWTQGPKRPLDPDERVFLGAREPALLQELQEQLGAKEPWPRARGAMALWLAQGRGPELAVGLRSALVEAAEDPLRPDEPLLVELLMLARQDPRVIDVLAASCDEARGYGAWALRDVRDRIAAEKRR